MSIELWAPPNLSKCCLREKVEEWRRKNPNTPPYERFIQDYISSQWPVLWHLKRKFILDLNSCSDDEEETPDDLCSICRCELGLGTESMQCGHRFHTMCIHRWMQRSETCPVCRASL
jgi:hypothetical protein